MLYKMVFMPTSVSFESYPKRIFVYSSSPVTVKVIALNRLGFGIPFKRLNGKFVVRGRERNNRNCPETREMSLFSEQQAPAEDW